MTKVAPTLDADSIENEKKKITDLENRIAKKQKERKDVFLSSREDVVLLKPMFLCYKAPYFRTTTEVYIFISFRFIYSFLFQLHYMPFWNSNF